MSASEPVKREVWVRCGGRCVICNKYLLEDHLDDPGTVRAIGEVAHIAGESEGGSRGRSETVAIEDRNEPANLILLCPNDHTSADKRGRIEDPQYTEEYLLGLKDTHETFVKFATGLRDERTTTVVRMFGGVRGAPGNVTKGEASAAVMTHALRRPWYLPDPSLVGLEIDLRSIPEDADDGYWTAARRQIDSGVERIHRDVAEAGTTHISVFAIALMPLLIALGNRLDDTTGVDVYDRHRSNDSWSWNEDKPAVTFGHETPADVNGEATEAVLIVNASGTIKRDELPAEVASMAVFTLAPDDGSTPSTSTFENAETLASFEAAVRSFFAQLERDNKHIRRLHLFAAVPVSAAVTLGRAIAVDNAAPTVAIYHRTDHAYQYTFDLPS